MAIDSTPICYRDTNYNYFVPLTEDAYGNSVYDDTITWHTAIWDSVNVVALGGGSNIMGFGYSDTVPYTVYGLAVTMNTYKYAPLIKIVANSSWLSDFTATNGLTPSGSSMRGMGDMGYYAMMLKCMYDTMDCRVEGMIVPPYFGFEVLDWSHLEFTEQAFLDCQKQTGKIRQSSFIYEFDTLAPNDTVSLFEFYFDSPHAMDSGEIFFAVQHYLGTFWFKNAYRMVCPHHAISAYPQVPQIKDVYGRGFVNECCCYHPGTTDFPPDATEYRLLHKHLGDFYAPLGSGHALIYPYIIPIVKLRCTTPREWAVEHEENALTFSWQHFDGVEGYEMVVNNVTAQDSTVATILDPDAVSHSLYGLDTTNNYYRIKLRKLCRYATDDYDTIVRSEWTEAFAFGTPPPPDPDTIAPGNDTIVPGNDTITPGIDTTGIRNLAEGLPFDLQPNPASGSVVLTLDAVEGGTVTVTDLAGREVLQQPLQPGAKRHKIDIGQLPAGAYLVRVTTPTATGTRRLLVR